MPSGRRGQITAIFLIFISLYSWGQLSEDFSDGDFTNAPVWTGDSDLFIVDNGILRSNSPDAANYFLSTSSSLVDDAQWEFWINLDFATSGANYVDVYLMADSEDLSAVENGYFLRFGETEDEISFYKEVAGSESVLIDGPDGELGSSNNIYRVRMQRTAGGVWTLELDEDDTGTFEPSGTISDAEINSSTHFGIRIEQSTAASVVNNHFFDDFIIAPIPVDEDPPELVLAEALNENDVRLTFSEPLEEVSAEAASNYFIDGGIGTPASATLEGTPFSSVILNLTTPLTNGETYLVTSSGVADLAGNIATDEAAEFTFFIAEEPESGEVVFNELFPDPNPPVGLPDFEFIEVYNRSDSFFDLENWVLVNTTTERVLNAAVLPPGGYLIICDNDAVNALSAFGEVLGVSSFPALSNGGDSLTLRDATGEVLDIVTYSDDWYGDSDFDEGGYSLERINPTLSCSGAFNWTASQDPSGGTPGTENSVFDDSPDLTPPMVVGFQVPDGETILLNFSESIDESSLDAAIVTMDQGVGVVGLELTGSDQIQVNLDATLEVGVAYSLEVSGLADCEGNSMTDPEVVDILIGETPLSGDLILTEIMADPNPPVGLPEAEYLELFNKSDKTLDLMGCDISGVVFEDPVLMSPGSYLAIASVANAGLFENFEGFVFLDFSTSFLTNGGAELVLTNINGEELDFVEYSDDWYGDPDKDDGGYSLELINPTVACSGAFNWTASSDPAGGSPGLQNSVFNDAPDIAPPNFIDYEVIESNLFEITFSEPLDEGAAQTVEVTISPSIPLVSLSSPRRDKILVELSGELQIGVSYIIDLANVQDCEGNVADIISFEILLGESPLTNEILITEIMADPSPSQGLPEGEYFELYNASEKYIDLLGCELSGLEFHESLIIRPEEYVFFASISGGSNFLLFPDVVLLEDMSTSYLTNGGRELILTNPDGLRIDRVNYDITWYGDPEKEEGGFSLERINLNEPCRGADNWTASVAEQGGTPGEENSVFSLVPDTTPPQVVTVYVLSETLLEIRFDEVLDSISVALTDFIFDPALPISGVSNAPPDYQSVLVTLGAELSVGEVYEVLVSGIADCVGNVNEESDAFSFALPELGEPGDIIINEILFNPRTGGSDFVELYNASQKNIGLQNWVVRNGDLTTRVISEDPLVIFPGQHMVLTEDVGNIITEYPMSGAYGDNFFEVEALPSFNNGEGTVILADAQENPIDRFDYSEDYHLSLLNSFDGVSLERISYTRPTNNAGNWSSAAERVGFATGGFRNSQYLPESRASAQFELEDEVFSPDNDGFEDVLLINYRLDAPGYLATIGIYDRRGRLVRQLENNLLLGTEGTITWDGTSDKSSKARLGPHLILIEIFTPGGNTDTFKLPCVVAGNLSD